MELALSLPEIRHYISLFIHPSDYRSCALVSRAWLESFVPRIWHSVTLGTNPVKDVAILQKYRALIRTLKLEELRFSTEIYDLFENLQALHFPPGFYQTKTQESIADLIRRNQSSLQRIHIDFYVKDYSSILRASYECLSLKHLFFGIIEFRERDLVDSFLKMCTRLTSLTLDEIALEEKTWFTLKDRIFPSLEQLRIEYVEGLFLDFLRACPNLKALSVYGFDDTKTEEFVEVIKTHCKQLSVFDCYHNGSEDVGLVEKLALVLPPMKCLQVELANRLDSQLPSSYSRHYETLQAINILHIIMNDGAGTQTILSSCPNLRWFYGDFIFAEDIESGSPWVCQRLESLQLDILVRNDDRRLDSVACAQLSQLKNLRSLNLAMPGLEDRMDNQHRSLSLRLGEGLELLASLSKLEHFGVGYILPEFREDWRTEDIEWMAQAWPNLEVIYHNNFNNKIHSRLCTHFGVSRVRYYFRSTDYMDFIDL